MKTAIIYIRVSTEEQADDARFSLAAQERLCSEFASKEKYKLLKIFSDPGKSATNMNRPGLDAVLNYIKENTVDAVIVQDTDRMARNTSDHLGIKAILKKYNSRLISVSQPFIDDSPEGKMLDTVLASFNEFQSGITGRKTKKGMEQRALDGWFPGEAPIGYKNIINSEEKRIIVPDEEKAPLIKNAFELYITGSYGAETINQIITAKGFKSKRNKKLTVSKFYTILNNPFYYGDFRWDGKIFPGKHKPIIDRVTFDTAQKIKNTRVVRRNYDRKNKFLLSGFLFCKCGRRFTAEKHIKKSGLKYEFYHCTRGKHCHFNRYVHTYDLEKQVEKKFKQVNFSDEFYKKVLDRLRYYYDNHDKENKKHINDLNQKLSRLEDKRDKIEKLLIEGTLNNEAFKRNTTKINSQIEELKINKLKIEKSDVADIGKFEDLVKFSKNISKNYKAGDFDIKKNYLNFFWEKFIVKDNKIKEAIPTEIFRNLQAIQKPLNKGDIVPLDRGLNLMFWGAQRESNPH